MNSKTILAAALAIATVLPVPAMAQFGFGTPYEYDQFVPRRLPMCLTDNQIRQAIARRGFDNIALNVPGDRRIQVRGTQNDTVYLIDFDFCADYVRAVKPLRPAG